MKNLIRAIICICFFISNAIFVGALEQQVNVPQIQKIIINQIFHGENYDLIIITPEEFKEDFEPLKQHKESKGVNTKIVGLNEIFDSIYFPAEGRDEAEKIKYFIKNAKDNWDIHYVMLVGGKDDMPVRYSHCLNLMASLKYLDKIKYPFTYPTTYLSDENKFISDLYYADIYDENGSFCSWDSNNNNLFGEMGDMGVIDEVDLYPDVYVGRMLCSDSTDVEIVINKIIEYENNAYGESWLNNIVLSGGDTHSGLSEEIFTIMLYLSYGHLCRIAWEGEYICEEISKLMNEYNSIKCYASGALKPNAKKLTVNNINNAINDGCSFFLFSGHGFGSAFGTHPPFNLRMWLPFPSMYTTSDVYDLNNKEKLPIAIFNTCHCANFDALSDPIAWEFINHENGGSVGSLACTTVSFSPQSSYVPNTYNGYLTMEIFKSYSEGTDILGELWGNSISEYLNDENAMLTFLPNLLWMHYLGLEEWILFGDPSLKIGGYL